MSPEINELLERFQGGEGVQPLNDGELETLRAGLEASADSIAEAGEFTPETVQQLQDLAEAATAVDARRTENAETAAKLQAEAEDALSRIRAHEENRTAQDQPEGQPGESEGLSEDQQAEREHAQDIPDQVDERNNTEDTGPEPESRTEAAIRRARSMQANRPARSAPKRRDDDRSPQHARAVVTAGIRHGSISVGDEIPSFDVLGEMIARRLQAMGPRGGSSLVASQFTTYPEHRRLDDNAARNEKLFEAVTSPVALTASGGVCTPVVIDYSIPTFSVADRPVKAALPGFGASRGGIRYLTPPTLSSISGATSIWTHGNDANPTSPTTKPVMRIACASEVQVIVDAVTLRLEIGNMMGRFSPEVVTANTQLAMAKFAQVAELNLLSQILAGSTEVTHTGAGLGATPELLATLDQALAGMRNYNRLSDSTPVRVILPHWVIPLLRSDMARRLATDASESNGGALNVSDAQIMSWFSNRSVNVSWTLDAIPAQGTGNTYPAQGFASQASGALLDYPASLVFPMYPEGTWQFLDGGQLDLGVVRDSTLDATNDYETFFETFEGVAKRGIVSYKVIVPLQPTGATAGTVDTHTYAGA